MAGLEAVTAAFGRAETIAVGSSELQLLLVKNPAGANEILRTLALEPGELEILAVLNDRIADGRDVSWIWDADFELLAGKIRRVTCTGRRAAELALRMKYAGVPTDRIRRRRRSGGRAGQRARTAPDRRRVYVLPTYTALLELRQELAARGLTSQFWEPQRPMTAISDAALWHDLECGRYTADLPCWRELAGVTAAPCWISAPGPDAWPSTWPATGTR